MISIEKLIVSYDKELNVIDMLDLQIPDNSINGIVGLNGTGKTTLLNAIYGLIKPKSGKILLNDKKISKKEIAFLPTENFFYSGITGREYLELFRNKNFDITDWNQLFQLPLNEIIDIYSTGMKKKLAFMGILKEDKPVMILDEPFNGLDLETVRILRLILLRLKEKGKTILITSHIIETLTNVCDYIHYLQDGKIDYSTGQENFPYFEQQLFEFIENKNSSLVDELLGQTAN